MEPIEVTVHFDLEGVITPLHFTWQGSLHRVESTGRRWRDEVGHHVLVMLATGRIYQLSFISGDGRWYIHRSPTDRAVI